MWLHMKVYTSQDLWSISLAVRGIREVVGIKWNSPWEGFCSF